MSGAPRRVVVVGSGQRIVGTVLPVLAARPDLFQLDAVLSRSRKTVAVGERSLQTVPFEELSAEHLGEADLLYLCVAKGAVPSVLKRLVALDPGRRDLVIDTPVLLFKHLGQVGLLSRFRRTWVAEDCSTLPWIELARRVAGPVRELRFEHSAWRYHGLALARTLLGDHRLKAARRRQGSEGDSVHLRFSRGGVATIAEPRDYARGRTTVIGAHAAVTDGPLEPGASLVPLRPRLDGATLTGFSAGDEAADLDPVEQALVGDVSPEASVTSLTEPLKRVGLLRLLTAVHDGGGGYPLELGLDDTVVDYLLEKLRVWRPSPLTSLRGPLGGRLLPAVLGLVGR